MAFDKRRNMDVLLGVFVTLGLVVFTVFVFLIGKESRLFDRSAHVNTYFKNVVGLSVGADVMLAGVLVGYVDKIGFPSFGDKDPVSAGKVKVVLRIPDEKLAWIRTNSIARIDGKGLLGDKIINISLGSPESMQIQNGGLLASIESIDFGDAMAKAQDVLTNVTGAVDAAKKFIEGFVSKGGDTALADTAHSIKNITAEIQSGSGLMHRLIYSDKAGADFESTLANLDKILSQGTDVIGNLNTIVENTKEGQGTLGRLLIDPSIYDDLKLILSNVERNRILKTLIRYSLEQKQLKHE